VELDQIIEVFTWPIYIFFLHASFVRENVKLLFGIFYVLQACKFLDESWCPKFMVVVAQKNHHTKFFQAGGSPDNVPPG
jgi:hypothetical protein